MGGPKLWTPADQKPVKIFRRNLLGVIRSWVSYKRPILVKIGQRGFSRHIREMYTPSGFFLTFFFFGFVNKGTAETAGPIFTRNTSKDVFLRKEGPFGV
jgi:hypothetical protein